MPKRVYPHKTGPQTMTLEQAADHLGVAPDVLVAALVDHGLSEAEARTARLLASEVEVYRAAVQRNVERFKEQLDALTE